MVCSMGATMVTMVRMDHKDSQIIDRLGGNSALAKEFDISSQAVSKWRKSGIPKPCRMYLKLAYPDVFASFIDEQTEQVT